MDPIIYGDTEASFGLIIRDRHNHDNYVFIDFEHLEKLLERYRSLKEKMSDTQKSKEEKN